MTNSLEELLREITSDPALENDFYNKWMSEIFTIEQLEVFVRNYGAFVKAFPDAMATLIGTTDDIEAKSEYVKTLYSEMGYGNPTKAHSVLFKVFFNELSKKLGENGRLDPDRLEKEIEVLPTTRELIDGEQELYGDPQMAFGAQLALEWQAYTMVRQLYEGARNYTSCWSNADEFHEACEYFYVHIGAAEKEHKDESLHAMRRYARDEESIARIHRGYREHLSLIAGFWNGLYESTRRMAA